MVDDDSSLAQTLSLYIQSRLLKNSQIIDRYYHAAVPGHYGKGTFLIINLGEANYNVLLVYIYYLYIHTYMYICIFLIFTL